jgi:hypothetical protein
MCSVDAPSGSPILLRVVASRACAGGAELASLKAIAVELQAPRLLAVASFLPAEVRSTGYQVSALNEIEHCSVSGADRFTSCRSTLSILCLETKPYPLPRCLSVTLIGHCLPAALSSSSLPTHHIPVQRYGSEKIPSQITNTTVQVAGTFWIIGAYRHLENCSQ